MNFLKILNFFFGQQQEDKEPEKQNTIQAYLDAKPDSVAFHDLIFEITRRCNMKCRHCMRGEAQDKTITREVIDEVLDQTAYIGNLVLTGGEPFLEPDMIVYLFSGIIWRKIPVVNFSCVTNGSIKNEKIAEAWNRLADYIAEQYEPTGDAETDRKALRAIGRIIISDDPYHKLSEAPFEVVKWYRQYLNQHCTIQKEAKKVNEVERVHMLGRAAEQEDLQQAEGAYYQVCPYRLEATANGRVVLTGMQIGYDGKLLIGEDSSYEQQDKCNYGNIFDEKIYKMIQAGAFDEPFSKKEALRYNLFFTELKTKKGRIPFTEDELKELLHYFDAIYTARQRAKKAMPWATHDDIVQAVYDDFVLNGWKNTLVIETLERYNETYLDCWKRMMCDRVAMKMIDPVAAFNAKKDFGKPAEKINIKHWEKDVR